MLRYAVLKNRPKDLLALTGLARREFEELLPVFERVLSKPSPRRKRRLRAPGGGRKPVLATAEDKLLFILVYLKAYPLQTVQAQLFGMSQQSANRYIQQLLPVLTAALDELGFLPEREGAQLAAHERRQGEGRDLIAARPAVARRANNRVDGVERPRQRPKKPKIQAIHYSGKKHGHFDKNVVVVNTRTRRVSFLSPTLPGSVHDKALADYARIRYPTATTLRSDLGFLGYQPPVREHLQLKKSRNSRS